MSKLLLTFIILVFLYSCSDHDSKSDTASAPKDSSVDNTIKNTNTSSTNIGYYKTDGDSLLIPSFEIEVDLSAKADKKLKKDKETIIVDASFSGQPKDTTSKYYQQNGEIFIAASKRELMDSNRVAKFEGVKLSKKLYDSLADKDIKLLINVYSGRRSTKDNLLNCDIFEDKVSKISGGKYIIKGKLIYGDN